MRAAARPNTQSLSQEPVSASGQQPGLQLQQLAAPSPSQQQRPQLQWTSLSLTATKADGYFQAAPAAPFAAAALPKQLPAPGPMLRNFVAGCIAACGAVTLTNPFDVVRTRLELQVQGLLACPAPQCGGWAAGAIAPLSSRCVHTQCCGGRGCK